MMKNKPRLFENKDFRFIKVKRKDKIPCESNWQTYKNYSFDDEDLKKWIIQGNNVGVATGFANLLVIDFDVQWFQDEYLEKLPKTLMQKSGSGKLHLFYTTDNPVSFKCKDKNNQTLADVQGKGKQIIVQPSTHPNGNKYEFVNNEPVAFIHISEVMALFAEYMSDEHKPAYNMDNRKELDVQKPILSSVLSKYGVDTTRHPTMCPFGHTSKGGQCFSWDDSKGVFNCFSCGAKGDVISFVEKIENVDFKKACAKLDIELESKKENKILRGFDIKSTIENVEYFFDNHTPFFYDKNGLFWFWNKKEFKYENVDDIDIMNDIDEQLNFKGLTVNKTIKSEYVEAFKRVGRMRHPKESPSKWIQFRNKAFSLSSGEIYDVKPNYFFTNPIPYDISDSSATPTMDKLIAEWVGEKHLQTIYEIIAYCCYADYPIHRIFCFMGSGRNGKSQLQRMIRTFLGEDNCSDADLDDLMENRFAAWSLYKKLMCSMGETNFGTMRRTQKIKKLSGQDPVTFEKKNVQSFDGYNYAKLIVNTNSLPSTGDTSDGFYRRWLIIKFPNEFPEGNDIIKTIPEAEYNNLAKKVCEILPDLLKKGEFTNEGSIKERKKNFEMHSNPLPYFVEKYCIRGDGIYEEQGHFYSEYCKFLSVQKLRKVTAQEFTGALNDIGLWINRTSKKIGEDDDGYKIYKSARWIDNIQVRPEQKYTIIGDEK